MRLALAVLLGVLGSAPDGPLTVSAAISLSGALEEIAKAYKAAGGGEVRFNFAASNVLARQIANGAPADLFISADEAQMDFAQDRGAIDAASRVPLLHNRLVLITQSERRAGWRDARALLGGDVRRVAVGDPAGVPAGVYAKQYLERIGVWQALQPKLLPLANVRAALAAVESGGADAGFVYGTDAASTPRVRVVFAVDGSNAPRIVYPAAITARSPNRAAAAKFLEFLRSPSATAIFARHGFRIPNSQRPIPKQHLFERPGC
jgi:molybdate transport system substrate-binding protein